MKLIEKLAQAILDGQRIREESFDKKKVAYKIDSRQALTQAVKDLKVDVRFAELLDLANYWWNDAQDWANEVLGVDDVERS